MERSLTGRAVRASIATVDSRFAFRSSLPARLAVAVAASLLILGQATAWGQPAPDWVRVTEKAEWQPRDSSGELVFRDQLWLFGGWFDSFHAPPRDVWSSKDGKSWRKVTGEAPWKHSDLPMTLAFRDRMWFLGGWYNGRLPGHGASSSVWSSADGERWELATEKAGWTPRIAAGATVFNDRMWILGGTENYYFGDDSSLRNDVWSSADGKEWKQETAKAPWSPRAYHASVTHAGRLWVLGGGNYVPKYHAVNDVWSSADGATWEQATASAPWSPRLWFSSVVYRNRIWVLGGWSNQPSRNWGDVWYSKDGKNWKQYPAKICWKERHEHSAYVFQDKIWVAGGHAQPLSSEVWSLEVPESWFQD